MGAALALAAIIVGKAPLAVRLARKAIEASFYSSLEDGSTLDGAFLNMRFASEGLRERIVAFG